MAAATSANDATYGIHPKHDKDTLTRSYDQLSPLEKQKLDTIMFNWKIENNCILTMIFFQLLDALIAAKREEAEIKHELKKLQLAEQLFEELFRQYEDELRVKLTNEQIEMLQKLHEEITSTLKMMEQQLAHYENIIDELKKEIKEIRGELKDVQINHRNMINDCFNIDNEVSGEFIPITIDWPAPHIDGHSDQQAVSPIVIDRRRWEEMRLGLTHALHTEGDLNSNTWQAVAQREVRRFVANQIIGEPTSPLVRSQREVATGLSSETAVERLISSPQFQAAVASVVDRVNQHMPSASTLSEIQSLNKKADSLSNKLVDRQITLENNIEKRRELKQCYEVLKKAETLTVDILAEKACSVDVLNQIENTGSPMIMDIKSLMQQALSQRPGNTLQPNNSAPPSPQITSRRASNL